MVILVREIKFRAWDGKKMHYQVRFGGVKDGIPLSPSGWDEKFGWTILSGNPVLEIMQFTGLYDKNGKEIYEQDILEVESFEGSKSVVIVVFDDGCFCHIGYLGDLRTYPLREFLFNGSRTQVIGNIFQDGDLLRDSKVFDWLIDNAKKQVLKGEDK